MNFLRQSFEPGDQIGLLQESLDFWDLHQKCAGLDNLLDKIQEINSTSCPEERIESYKKRLQKIVRREYNRQRQRDDKLKVYVDGFWPGFSFTQSALSYLFKMATGRDTIEVHHPKDADIALYSIFTLKRPMQDTNKLVRYLFLGERVSPSFHQFDYSLTMDIPEYSGKNIYTPLWLLHLLESNKVSNFKINSLQLGHQPQTKRMHKAVFVGNNDHPLRRALVSKLTQIGIEVDCFGSSFRPISDKLELYRKYVFSICPENCWNPGYTTEKIVDSFFADTIPIYWGYLDDNIFNPDRAIILNHVDSSLDELSKIAQGLPSVVNAKSSWLNQNAALSLVNTIIQKLSRTFPNQ